MDSRAPWAAAARLSATVLLAACACNVLIAKIGARAADNDDWIGSSGDYYVAEGEALVHGIALPQASRSMPAFSVPHALLRHHAGAGTRLLTHGLSLLAAEVLVFSLGWLLHSGLCGGLAALIFACIVPLHLSSDRWLYSLQVLVVAVALLWRARAPSLRRSMVLGLSLAMSLMILSPLFLFPLALALYECIRQRAGRALAPKGWARQMAVISIACLLPLSIWASMNWRTQHRLILFEDGRAQANIVTGALGFVSTASRPGGIPEATTMQDVMPWAVQEVLRHPSRYLDACGQRLAYAASFHPFLYLAALAAVVIFFRREGHRQLALLAAYFTAVHCLMSVEERYFEPALPLLCALAASALAGWLRPTDDRAGEKIAAAALGAVLTPMLALQLYALGLTAAYAGRAAQPSAIDRELSRYPEDPWLWSQKGEQLLREGNLRGAQADLSRALALDPRLDQAREKLSWARLMQDGGDALSWERSPPGTIDAAQALRQSAFRTLSYLQQGRLQEARACLDLMGALWADLPVFRRQSDAARFKPRFDAASARSCFQGVLADWPVKQRPVLREMLELLLSKGPKDPAAQAEIKRPDFLLYLAERARQGGRPETARGILDSAAALRLHSQQARRLWEMSVDLRHYQLAPGLIVGPAGRTESSAALLLDLADKARQAQRPETALAILDSAAALSLDDEQARRLWELCRNLEPSRRALNSTTHPLQRERQSPAPTSGLAGWLRQAGRSGALRLLELAARVPLPQNWGRQVGDRILDLGFAAARAGQRRMTAGALDSMERTVPAGRQLCRMMELSVSLQQAAPALSAFRRARALTQCPADSLLDLAGTAEQAGLRDDALQVLDAAAAWRLDERQLLSAALLYGALRKPEKAAASLRRLQGRFAGGRSPEPWRRRCALLIRGGLSEPASGPEASLAVGRPRDWACRLPSGPADAGLLLDGAESASEAGDAASARRCARKAGGFKLTPEGMGRLALVYNDLKDYRSALAILDRLVREQPGQARWRGDRGVANLLLGAREEAILDWKQAIALDAGFLPAYLSLGSLYAASGRRQDSRRLYEQALDQALPNDSAGGAILQQIQAGRDGLSRRE